MLLLNNCSYCFLNVIKRVLNKGFIVIFITNHTLGYYFSIYLKVYFLNVAIYIPLNKTKKNQCLIQECDNAYRVLH
ncbi:hypothetical protein FIO01_09540 [Yersinia pestis]|nr:hypothetical protein FIO01_09540 [Yersinia pestis]